MDDRVDYLIRTGTLITGAVMGIGGTLLVLLAREPYGLVLVMAGFMLLFVLLMEGVAGGR